MLIKKNQEDGSESRAEIMQTGYFLLGPPTHNSCQCAELMEDEQHSVWQAAELNDTMNKAKVMAWSKHEEEARSLFLVMVTVRFVTLNSHLPIENLKLLRKKFGEHTTTVSLLESETSAVVEQKANSGFGETKRSS